MRVTVDPALCEACGLCADTCPEVFELGDKYAIVKKDPVPQDQEECAKEAAELCPVEAISVSD